MLQRKTISLSNLSLFEGETIFLQKIILERKKNYVMDLCLVTLRSFVVQWSVKITGHRPQLKPLPITHCGVNMFGPFTVK